MCGDDLRAVVERALAQHRDGRLTAAGVVELLRDEVGANVPLVDAPLTPAEALEEQRAHMLIIASALGVPMGQLVDACRGLLQARLGPAFPAPYSPEKWLECADDIYRGSVRKPSIRPISRDFHVGDWVSPVSDTAFAQFPTCRTVQKVNRKTIMIHAGSPKMGRVSKNAWRLSTPADAVARWGFEDLPRIMRKGAIRG